MSKTLAPGEIVERELAAEIGLPHKKIAAWRKENLDRSTDWRYEREVILTAPGKAKVEGFFQVGKIPVRTPDVMTATVHKRTMVVRNPRLLILDNGVELLVRDNKNFRPGMPVKYKKDRSGRWVLEGRCPRWPGRY